MLCATTISASDTAYGNPSWSRQGNVGYQQVSSAYAASDEKAALRSEVAELMMDCVQDGWDGYGATAASKESFAAAQRFVNALPTGFKMPEVSVDTDGCFNFEWRRSARRTLLVSVHPDFTLHYASLVGNSRHYGDEPFFNRLPSTLERLLEHLYSL